jgi:hypothetical protein
MRRGPKSAFWEMTDLMLARQGQDDFSVVIRGAQKSHRFGEPCTPIGDDTPKFNLNNSIARVSLACRASEGISMA